MECKDCKHKKTCDYHREVIEPLYEIIGYPWDGFLKGLNEYVNDNFNCQYKEIAEGASMAT